MTEESFRQESLANSREIDELRIELSARIESYTAYYAILDAEDVRDSVCEDLHKELEMMMSLVTMQRERVLDWRKGVQVRAIIREMKAAIREVEKICEELERLLTTKRWSPVLYVDQKLNVSERPAVGIFDPRERHCRHVGHMPVPKTNFATAIHHSQLYIVGGMWKGEWLRSVEMYDKEMNVRRECRAMKIARTRPAATFHENRLYVAGGFNGKYLNSVEIYDPETDEWKEGPRMKKARTDARLVSLDGSLYIFGGYNGCHYEESIEKLNADSQQFEIVGNMGGSRAGFAACAFKGRVYIAGGWSSTTDTLRSVRSYDPVRNEWRDEPSLLQARKYFMLHATNETIYAIRGCASGRNIVPAVEWLNTATGIWELF